MPIDALGLMWTPHPVFDRVAAPLNTDEVSSLVARLGPERAAAEIHRLHRDREQAIALSKSDPLNHGHEPQHWKDARALLEVHDELIILGGNGSGKTEFGAKWLVNSMHPDDPQAEQWVLGVTTSDELSKQKQQASVFKYLPPHLKEMARGRQTRNRSESINYSQKNGFTSNTFVLGNQSQCWFKTLEQYQRRETAFEGPEYDAIHLDEPVTLSLVQTLRLRAAKRSGKLLLTFTAVDGFDSVCSEALTGAVVAKSLPITHCWPGFETDVQVPELRLDEVLVDGCPPGHMPYILRPLNPRLAVVCWWTQWNVFTPWRSIFQKMVGRPKAAVRCRLFGWVEKRAGNLFPTFKTAVHVVPHTRVPKDGTDYMAGDPATVRSFFMLWCRVDPLGRKWIFDESPRTETEGEWVTADGERGEGQKVYAGMGTAWTAKYIWKREEEHNQEAGRPERPESWVARRVGDPRGFATQSATSDGATSYMDLFANGDPPMYWDPAPVRQTVNLDTEIISEWLSYDASRPLSVENEPKLFISDRCTNLIRSMLNYTPREDGTQDLQSPWKDPIDCLRYLAVIDPQYQDPNVPEIAGGRGF